MPNSEEREAAVTYYSKHAKKFHDSYSRDPNRLERLSVWSRVVDANVGHVALAYDIGCGSGMLTRLAAEKADRVIAIDGAAGMLEVARENLLQAGFSNVAFQQAFLPIEDTADYEPADLVISSSVLEYLDSLDDALRFVRSLVKPGGTLIFSMSNKSSIYRKLVRGIYTLTARPSYFGLLKHFVDADSMSIALAKHGLTCISHEYFGGKDRINSILSVMLPARHSTNMILFVAKASS